MKDPVVEKSELVIDALKYAQDHNLDINNQDDVAKILEVLDPEHTEDIDEFMELLKNAEVAMDILAKKKDPEKTNLPN